MRLAYLVPTWTGGKLVETIHSIPKGERCMVIDNSVTDTPLSASWNYGIRRLIWDEHYDVVIVCNDDIILRPETGPLLAEALVNLQDKQERAHQHAMLLMVTAYNTRDLPDVGPRWGTGPDFSCFAVDHRLFDQVGEFDEKFRGAYFEDNDMHRRIQLCGFEAMSYAPYYHYGSQTVNGPGDLAAQRSKQIADDLFPKNASYYESKWGGPPGRETFTTPFNRR